MTSAVSARAPRYGRCAPRSARHPPRQREPGLFEQADLLAVEQLDLESGGPAAQAKGRPGEQVGPSGAAGPFGCLPEPGPAAVQVAGRQPGRAEAERGGRLVGVAAPARGQAGRDVLVPVRRVLEGQGGHGTVSRAAGVLGGLLGCGRACPDQVVGGLGVVHVPAAPGQGGQHAARLGVQFLAVGLGDRVVDGVADHLMPEPVLTGTRGLEEAGVAAGGQRVGQLGRWHSGHRGQHVSPEARAQNRGGLEYRTGGDGQFGQPRMSDHPDGLGDHRAGGGRVPALAGELAGQLGHQQGVAAAALGDDPDQVRLGRRPGHPGHQAGHVILPERRQRDHQAGPQQGAALVQPALPGLVAIARGDQHGRGHGPQGRSQLGQQPQRRHIGLVRVVDDHEHRPPRGRGRDDLGQVKGQLGPRPLGVSRTPAQVAARPASAARNGEPATSCAAAAWLAASVRTTRDHGRSGAPPAADGHHVQMTSKPAARSAAASASRVLPMPGSPVSAARAPRPARAAASTESTSASAPARATSGYSTPMTTPPRSCQCGRTHGCRSRP